MRVPNGFATTADAYRRFIAHEDLAEAISVQLADLDIDDVARLAVVGRSIRSAVVAQPFPPDLEAEIRAGYAELAGGDEQLSFAVRSSATAEDLPDASFAGQQETFLNIRGSDAIMQAIKEVFASLYNDRAIAYRVHHDFDHDAVALSAGVQQMVRSDIGASGVMFTMDTESGFTDAVFITCHTGWVRPSFKVRSIPTSFTSTSPRSPPIGQQSSSEESAKRRSRWSTPAMPRSGGRPSSSTSSRPTGWC